MAIIVQKYGGTSVADAGRIKKVAEKIAAARKGGSGMVVVVSAMGHTTDDLLGMAREIDPEPDRRELDMLLSVGERVSMALLTMAIHKLGYEAISLTGSQSGIITNDSHTDARIIEVRPYRIQDELQHGRIVIVAGYQGVSYKKEITTLGRGGSDTTAIALAAALGADYCDIFSDVDGIFTADPNIVPSARKIDSISYEEMQELARSGARVLNFHAVEFARRNGIAIYSKSSFLGGTGTMIGAAGNGRAGAVTGVAIEENIVLLRTTEMEPGKLSLLLDALHKCGIAPSGIVLEQVRIPGNEKSGTFLSMTVSLENIHDYLSMKERLIAMADGGFSTREGLSTVSLVGNGIGEDCSIIGRLVRLAADSGSELISTSISHSRITALVDGGTARNLLAECHGAFIEGDARKAG